MLTFIFLQLYTTAAAFTKYCFPVAEYVNARMGALTNFTFIYRGFFVPHRQNVTSEIQYALPASSGRDDIMKYNRSQQILVDFYEYICLALYGEDRYYRDTPARKTYCRWVYAEFILFK